MADHNGFVVRNDGEIMIQLCDDDGFTLYSRDGESAYPLANGLPNCEWVSIAADDPLITDDDRAVLAWLQEDNES